MEPKVMRPRRTKEGIIIHELNNGEEKKYLAVRGGLSWPLMAGELPGYFCILGEEWIPVPLRATQRGRLILLSEYEAPDIHSTLDDLFTRLIHEAALYFCEIYYTDTGKSQGEDFRSLVADFQRFAYGKENTGRIEQAPWADDPERGLQYVNDWFAKTLLELTEGSIVRDQLKMMGPEKIKQVPQMFNAVNALRFVLCGFQNDKPNPSPKNWRGEDRGSAWAL